MITVGSLFSGIGGLDLGLERAGFEIRWQVENDPWCRQVLTKHWPTVPKYGDITTLHYPTLKSVDLICGGFPCQPISQAGLKKGADDDRWLWPYFADTVRHLRPRVVLVENVSALTIRGLDTVLGDLAQIGYDTEWQRIPAAAVGAPHLRERIFIVGWPTPSAATDPDSVPLRVVRERRRQQRGEPWEAVARDDGTAQPMANADSVTDGRLHPRRQNRPTPAIATGNSETVAHAEIFTERTGLHTPGPRGQRWRPSDSNRDRPPSGNAATPDTERQPHRHGLSRGVEIQPRGPTSDDLSEWWTTEPNMGRVAHGIPRRVDRLKGLGNAVVPQLAQWIGHQIQHQFFDTH